MYAHWVLGCNHRHDDMKLHRELNTKEEKEFAEWARDNWPLKVGFAWGDEPNPMWHPIVQGECRRMNVQDHVRKLREGGKEDE